MLINNTFSPPAPPLQPLPPATPNPSNALTYPRWFYELQDRIGSFHAQIELLPPFSC